MEAQSAAAARATAPPPEPQQHPTVPSPYLPAPQFTFQPFQRDPPLYFDSRTASFRPDAVAGSGSTSTADFSGPAAAFRFSASAPAPVPVAPPVAGTGLLPRPAGGARVVEYQLPSTSAGASATPYEAPPHPAQMLSSTAGRASGDQQPAGIATGASGAPHGTLPDPAAPGPQSRNLAESLQAAATARQREASLVAAASTAAAEPVAVIGPREASTVVITEVPPSPQQLSRQAIGGTAAPRQQTEPHNTQRSSQAQGGTVAVETGASARVEPALTSASPQPRAAAADVRAELSAKLSAAKSAAAGGDALEPADADFKHLPPHLRPKYAAAALSKTAAKDGPASRPASAASQPGGAAPTAYAGAVHGAECCFELQCHF